MDEMKNAYKILAEQILKEIGLLGDLQAKVKLIRG
jgi:hypothetical protein